MALSQNMALINLQGASTGETEREREERERREREREERERRERERREREISAIKHRVASDEDTTLWNELCDLPKQGDMVRNFNFADGTVPLRCSG